MLVRVSLPPSPVLAGLDPVTHVFRRYPSKMSARLKAGHDGGMECAPVHLTRALPLCTPAANRLLKNSSRVSSPAACKAGKGIHS